MSATERLVLNQNNFAERTFAFYRKMNTSPNFMKKVVEDPARIMAEELFAGEDLPSVGEINQANRILFSLLSNPKFIEWSKDFEERMASQVKQEGDNIEALNRVVRNLDRSQLYNEIASAAQQFIDKEWIYNRMTINRSTAASNRISGPFRSGVIAADIAVCIETFIYAVAVGAVFAVAVAAVFLGESPVESGLSRFDLQRIASALAGEMDSRAQALRESGALLSVANVEKGTTL